jgi:HAD superfamily hydrolase (TIGR01509 family)
VVYGRYNRLIVNAGRGDIMGNRAIHAVFFDMDNTLVETEWAAARAVRQVVESYGGVFESADEEAIIGLPWATIFENTIKKYGLPLDTNELKRQVLERKVHLMANDPHELPGGVDALRRCSTRWPVAVVSGSYREEVRDTIAALGLDPYIRFFVSNEDCIPGKPDPGPYLLAASRLNIAPENCLVFEDSEVGIQAARSAGMFCVAVEIANTVGLDLSGADLRIPTLETVTDTWLDSVVAGLKGANT